MPKVYDADGEQLHGCPERDEKPQEERREEPSAVDHLLKDVLGDAA